MILALPIGAADVEEVANADTLAYHKPPWAVVAKVFLLGIGGTLMNSTMV